MTDFMDNLMEMNRIVIRMKARNDRRIHDLERRIDEIDRQLHRLHTTYFLIRPDGTEKEYYSLKDAKAAAEKENHV